MDPVHYVYLPTVFVELHKLYIEVSRTLDINIYIKIEFI